MLRCGAVYESNDIDLRRATYSEELLRGEIRHQTGRNDSSENPTSYPSPHLVSKGSARPEVHLLSDLSTKMLFLWSHSACLCRPKAHLYKVHVLQEDINLGNILIDQTLPYSEGRKEVVPDATWMKRFGRSCPWITA